MAIEIKKFSLTLIKESNSRYDFTDKKADSPGKARDIFNQVLNLNQRTAEVFSMLTLDTKNHVTGVFEVTVGTLNASIVHPREVFQRAILQNASAIIIAHNHPSGNPEPSKEDIKITDRIMDSGKILGINVLDHIIVGEDNRYYSFKENKLC